jgi:hypothetical protein
LNPAKQYNYENKIKETGGPNKGNKAGDNIERIANQLHKNRMGFGERNDREEVASMMQDRKLDSNRGGQLKSPKSSTFGSNEI